MAELGMVWTWIAIGILVAFPLSVLCLHWKIETYKRELTAALVDLQEHAHVLKEDAAKNAQWYGDLAYRIDLPFDEVERRIREAHDKLRIPRRAKARFDFRFNRSHA